MKPARARRARRRVDWPCEKSYALSRRVHLDLFRRFRPALDCRLEVALERLELGAELVRGSRAIATRVERRVLERRHDFRDLRFQLGDPSLRLRELTLGRTQLFPRVRVR